LIKSIATSTFFERESSLLIKSSYFYLCKISYTKIVSKLQTSGGFVKFLCPLLII